MSDERISETRPGCLKAIWSLLTDRRPAPKASDAIFAYLDDEVGDDWLNSELTDGWIDFGPEEEGWEGAYLELERAWGKTSISDHVWTSIESKQALRNFADQLRSAGH